MTRLSVLAPTRYPWRFNGPRHSRHDVHIRSFLPLNRIDARMEGVTVFNPLPPRRFDLVHAFNRLPIGNAPYVIGFESHLPRAYGLERTAYFARLRQSLAGRRCRGSVAISNHARTIFHATHAGSAWGDALIAKLVVRHPNLPVADVLPVAAPNDGPVHVSFVGGHFARKGGCVAVRLAELATERRVPLRVTIVSALTMGGGIWTDPLRAGYFDDWRRRLRHPAITLHDTMANADVVELFRRSDLTLLTTFGDTFGYSALEAMAVGCPVIGTRQGALPEFIVDGSNGVLLDLPVSALGEWVHSSSPDRGSPAFERLFTGEVDRLAHEALAAIEAIGATPGALSSMRRAAHATIRAGFDSRDATRFWDDYYETSVQVS